MISSTARYPAMNALTFSRQENGTAGLPGIELGTEMRVTCGNVEVDDARVRETTRRDLRIRRRC